MAERRADVIGRLYESHGASLYRYDLMLLADAAAAEDVVHFRRQLANRAFERDLLLSYESRSPGRFEQRSIGCSRTEGYVKRTIAIIAAVLALSTGTAYAQQCLHGPDETAEENARRRDALAVTRLVNTAQAAHFPQKSAYFLQSELATTPYIVKNQTNPLIQRISFDPNGEILPGWKLTLDLAQQGYWFIVKDVKDPCGFAYISNQRGVIYTAESLR